MTSRLRAPLPTWPAAAAAAALAVSALAGCAPREYYRNTESSLDSLLTMQGETQRRLGTLDRKIENTRESVQASKASTDSRLSELTQRIDVLQGKLEESGVRFTQLAQKVETVKQRISTADSARAAQGWFAGRDSTGGMDPETAYQAAYSDVTAGRYSLAKEAFTEYLRRYPDTEESDNAQFWIGECAFMLGDLAGAIDAYQKVVQNYPKGNKVAGALFKTGAAYGRLKNVDEAKKYYRMVIQRFPKSEEARLAKERLAER
jgi:tol-pal system protein YbgF